MREYLKEKCKKCCMCSEVTESITGAPLTPYHQCLADVVGECYEDGMMYEFILNGKSFDTKDKYKGALREYFEDRWDNGGGFMHSLCDLLTKADFINLDLLVQVYPDLVNGYSVFAYNKLYCELHKTY